jgi:hypothetical protein
MVHYKHALKKKAEAGTRTRIAHTTIHHANHCATENSY